MGRSMCKGLGVGVVHSGSGVGLVSWGWRETVARLASLAAFRALLDFAPGRSVCPRLPLCASATPNLCSFPQAVWGPSSMSFLSRKLEGKELTLPGVPCRQTGTVQVLCVHHLAPSLHTPHGGGGAEAEGQGGSPKFMG